MNIETKEAIRDLCKVNDEIVILDAYNLLFRYFYSHKDLSVTTEDGIKFLTGHLYGFVKNLLRLKECMPNCGIIVCVDGMDKSRREIYPEYKANRKHEFNPEDDIGVLKSFSSLVKDVYWCYNENYEADDEAASIARTFKHLCNKFNIKKTIYLISSDRDWWQLIDDGKDKSCSIKVVKKWGNGDEWLSKAEIIDEAAVREEFNGTSPENLLKFRAITGDSSDNIKGYYRFFKKNAAIIAENFDYNEDTAILSLKEGIEMRASWHKFLHTVTDNMVPFARNYKLMTLKDIDFELEDIDRGLDEESVKDIVKGLSTLKLYSYMSNVHKFSNFSDEIKKCVDEDKSMKIDESIDKSETAEMSLDSIL